MRYQVEIREGKFAVVDTDVTMPRTGEYVLIALLPDRRTALDYADEQNMADYLLNYERQQDDMIRLAYSRYVSRILQY